MLLARNQLPPLALTNSSALITNADIGGSSLYANRGKDSVFEVNDLNTSLSVSLTEETLIEAQEDSYFVSFELGNINILELTINGVDYVLTNNLIPGVNEYSIDFDTGKVIINTGYNSEGMTAIITVITPQAKLNKINNINNIPSIFRQYIAFGDFSLTRTFQGHPTGNFQIRCNGSQVQTIKNALKPGTEITLLKTDLRVAGLTIGRSLNTFRQVLISVQLQGYWQRYGNTLQSPLDHPIKEKSLIIETNDCEGFEYSYKAALGKAGIQLRGGNIVKKVPRTISSSEKITARQLLEDAQRLLVEGYYIDWNYKIGPTLKKWKTPKIHRVDSLVADLSLGNGYYPEIVFQENGFGSSLSGCFLSHELNGHELILDQNPNEQDGDELTCLTQGDRNPFEPPRELRGAAYYSFDYTRLRSPSMCFDNGQLTKQKIDYCQLNGTEVERTEQTYGFAFTSADIFDYRIDNNGSIIYFPKTLSEILLNTEWELVKEVKYLYTFDSNTGHFQGKQGKGWELTRDLKETEDREAITLLAAIAEETDLEAIANLTRQLNGYTTFYKRTITSDEAYQLEDLSNYYPDLNKPDEDDQADYVPALFARISATEDNSLILRADPRGTNDEPQPDLIIGATNKDIKQIDITSRSPERFTTWNPIANQQGTNLEESSYSESFEENSGRPSTQNRLVKTDCHKPKKEPQDNLPKYTVNTQGSQHFTLSPGSITYPGAYTLSQATKAVNTDYSIKNSQSSCTTSLPLGEQIIGLSMGDIVIFQGTRWRVFGEALSGRIQPDGVVLTNYNLEVGQDIEINAIVKTS